MVNNNGKTKKELVALTMVQADEEIVIEEKFIKDRCKALQKAGRVDDVNECLKEEHEWVEELKEILTGEKEE